MPGLSSFTDRASISILTAASFYVLRSFSVYLIMLPFFGFLAWILILKTSFKQIRTKLCVLSQIRVPGHMLVNMNAPKMGTCLLMIDRVKFLRLCHTQKIFYNISAPYLHDNFVRVAEVHRVKHKKQLFQFQGPKCKGCCFIYFLQLCNSWLKLTSKEIKRIKNLYQFKSAIKIHLANCALLKK